MEMDRQRGRTQQGLLRAGGCGQCQGQMGNLSGWESWDQKPVLLVRN